MRSIITSSAIITDVTPVTAPSETSAATQRRPTELNASASGAPSSKSVYGIMPVSTRDTAM